MKIDKTKKLSNYYRTSSYVTALEKISNIKTTTLYQYITDDLKINRKEGLQLSPINSTQKEEEEKLEAIKPIKENDFYA